jgi:L-histidine N-alpha-methyltransferase
VPFDVDRVTLESTAGDLMREYPGLSVHGVVGDFERDLGHVPPALGRRLVLFLGSTIGNLDPVARQALLAGVGRLLDGPEDRLLLGVDLVKDVKVLEAAYDDAAGVTEQFNRNILRVVNRATDGDFDPEAFRHLAFYNAAEERIEMHLVAASRQKVHLARLGIGLALPTGDSIWTESSYKFTRAGVEAMLAGSGLHLVQWWTDPACYFALILARAA